MSERANLSASAAQPSSSSRDRNSNARLAVTLGAAFALMCVAIFGIDTAESLAAGGLFDFLFGGGSGGAVVAPFPGGYGYGYGAGRRHYGHYRRHARHGRRYQARYAYAHRQMVERRRSAAAERRDDDGDRRLTQRAGGVERVSFAEMSAAAPATPQTLARRTVCVRACDGYFFPIANLNRASEIPAQQATCNKLCPGAQAQLYVMPAGSDRIEDAVAARGGDTYASLVARVSASDEKSQSCSCQMNASAASHQTSMFQSDFTLRPGDSVVTPQGVRILRRGSHYPYKERDFVSLAETRDVPASSRSALVAIERVLNTPHGRLLASNGERRRAHHQDPRY
jgi:hypothetical protein